MRGAFFFTYAFFPSLLRFSFPCVEDCRCSGAGVGTYNKTRRGRGSYRLQSTPVSDHAARLPKLPVFMGKGIVARRLGPPGIKVLVCLRCHLLAFSVYHNQSDWGRRQNTVRNQQTSPKPIGEH
ncbi:hypothetical protein BJY52DRAFT_410059 [Lactarius psammicola]|nr:hypothetical protein BJY52DRAFT_410059 [Lactarius psammicola]